MKICLGSVGRRQHDIEWKAKFNSIYQTNPEIHFHAYSNVWDLRKLCPSPGRHGWMCEDRSFMMFEQKRLREYFSPCEITNKELCFSVGLFREPQTSAAYPPRTEWHLCCARKEDLNVAWCKDSRLRWQYSGGPVRPERHNNYRVRMGLRKTSWRRKTPSCYWAELTYKTTG